MVTASFFFTPPALRGTLCLVAASLGAVDHSQLREACLDLILKERSTHRMAAAAAIFYTTYGNERARQVSESAKVRYEPEQRS